METFEQSATIRRVSIPSSTTQQVSGLFQESAGTRACYVLAHGAGAGMTHPFLVNVAAGLAQRKLSTLRYQFPYMETGSKRPDVPRVAHGAVRGAVAEAAKLCPTQPLFAGGKSFGGRMTSQAQAASPLSRVVGLIFLGFPLHPPDRPSIDRAEHLLEVRIPMLFLQGDRDPFARTDLLQSVITQLGQRATLKLFTDADHSFHVPARAGRKDADVMAELLDVIGDWTGAVLGGAS